MKNVINYFNLFKQKNMIFSIIFVSNIFIGPILKINVPKCLKFQVIQRLGIEFFYGDVFIIYLGRLGDILAKLYD
jgi:hypothetical protein